MVMIEALELGSKVKWVTDLWQSLEVFGWKELDVEALSGLTMREVKLALKAIAWRKVREVWKEEARGQSKVMIGWLTDYECKARCVEVDCKRQRSMLAKLRHAQFANVATYVVSPKYMYVVCVCVCVCVCTHTYTSDVAPAGVLCSGHVTVMCDGSVTLVCLCVCMCVCLCVC